MDWMEKSVVTLWGMASLAVIVHRKGRQRGERVATDPVQRKGLDKNECWQP